jgi:hypothetical protein
MLHTYSMRNILLFQSHSSRHPLYGADKMYLIKIARTVSEKIVISCFGVHLNDHYFGRWKFQIHLGWKNS